MRPLREAFSLVLRSPRIWGLQLPGNVLILLLFTAWLRLSEAHWWDLLLNLIVIVLVAVAALALHGGTLNYYQSAHADRSAMLTPEFKKALKHVLALAVWAAIFFFLWLQVDGLSDYQYALPGFLRSELPGWLRKHTTDSGFTDAYQFAVTLLRWVVLPGLLLPPALLAAGQGFRGLVRMREWGGMLRSVSYWTVLVLAALLGVAVTAALMGMKMAPRTATLRREEISLFFRLLASYLCGMFAWLWMCSMLGRLRRGGQPAA